MNFCIKNDEFCIKNGDLNANIKLDRDTFNSLIMDKMAGAISIEESWFPIKQSWSVDQESWFPVEKRLIL